MMNPEKLDIWVCGKCGNSFGDDFESAENCCVEVNNA